MPAAIKSQHSRIETIDIVRGLALLGILFVNIQTYSLFSFLKPGQVYNLGFDKPATYDPLQFAISLLIRNEFYCIYSFLFGFGFYMMFRKNELQGLDATAIYKRRLYTLLIIGLIHGLVFWFGDVLHKYALIGFSLLYFNKKSVAVIIKWMIGLFLFVIIYQVCREIFFAKTATQLAAENYQSETAFMHLIDVWQHGSFGEVMELQRKEVMLRWLKDLDNGLPSIVQAQILFLAGLVAGKLNLFSSIKENKTESRLMSMVLFSIPPAIALKGLYCMGKMEVDILPQALQPYQTLIYSLCSFTGSLLLVMVYLPLLFILLRNNTSRVFTWIGKAGKMGLTNYLTQTAICMALFYGYAGGLSGKLTLFQSVLIAVFIYSVQVIYSNAWLNKHASGPLEMLWKKIVYKKEKPVKMWFKKERLTPVDKEALFNAIECI